MNKAFTCICGNRSDKAYKIGHNDGSVRDGCWKCAGEFDREQGLQIYIENCKNAKSERETMNQLYDWKKI